MGSTVMENQSSVRSGKSNGLIAMLATRKRKPRPNFPQEPKNNDAPKQWQEYNEMQLRQLKSYAVMPIALMLLLAGCAMNSPSCKPASVEPARIPELPSAARQQPVPQWCYPTCTEAVRLDSTNSLKRLTEEE